MIGDRLRLGRVGLTQPAPGKSFEEADHDDIVQGIVLLRRGENALDVLARVRAKVKEINRHDLPPGVRIVPHYDRTELIERTLHTVRHNMIEGIALVVLVLLLFLGSATGVPRSSWRPSCRCRCWARSSSSTCGAFPPT